MLFSSKVWVKKVDKLKNWSLTKNPQFLSNLFDISATWNSLQRNIFEKDWTTIVDFLLIANFWACVLYFYSHFNIKPEWWNEKLNKRVIIFHNENAWLAFIINNKGNFVQMKVNHGLFKCPNKQLLVMKLRIGLEPK